MRVEIYKDQWNWNIFIIIMCLKQFLNFVTQIISRSCPKMSKFSKTFRSSKCTSIKLVLSFDRPESHGIDLEILKLFFASIWRVHNFVNCITITPIISGKYGCTAKNKHGSEQRFIELNVYLPPMIKTNQEVINFAKVK